MAGLFLCPVLKCICGRAYASDAQGKAIRNVPANVFGLPTGRKKVFVSIRGLGIQVHLDAITYQGRVGVLEHMVYIGGFGREYYSGLKVVGLQEV